MGNVMEEEGFQPVKHHETPFKRVGRRLGIPKGVYRLKTFEEADEWMERWMKGAGASATDAPSVSENESLNDAGTSE